MTLVYPLTAIRVPMLLPPPKDERQIVNGAYSDQLPVRGL